MIAIPNPCAEDFSKMTPTEKGAFCDKCATDTYDFRKLNNPQILRLIADNKGKKMCGQFRSGQLRELNAGYATWKSQTPRTFRSKFLFAVLLGFGLTLFSCSEKQDIFQEEINAVEKIVEAIPTVNYINQETNVSELDLLDYVNANWAVPENETIGCELEYELGGDIAYYDEIIEDPEHYTTAGVPMMTTDFVNYATVITVDEDSATTSTLPEEIAPIVFTSKVFPNPSKGYSTIEIIVEQEDAFEINVYDLKGNLINVIFKGNLSEGPQRFELDLSNENSGMYFVKLTSSSHSETLKLSRVN